MSRVAHSVQEYWRKQRGLMLALPAEVETGETDAVHDLRAAGRRLKATIRVYRPLLRPKLSEWLLAELDWFNAELGKARDAEVIHEQLTELLSGYPEAQPLLDTLAARQEHLRLDAVEMLDDDRVAGLVSALEGFVHRPWRRTLDTKQEDTARQQILGRIDWARGRVLKAWRDADADSDADRAGLHLLRRRAKATRYAFESVSNGYPQAVRQVRFYAELSELLGVVQDAAMVEDALTAYPGELAQIAIAEQYRRATKAESSARDLLRAGLPEI